MALSALQTPRFLQRTTLTPNEYRRNFRQIDNDVISVVTSQEADAVTPLMSKIYLRLILAPDQYVEGPGVLRFSELIKHGQRLTAWEVLCEELSVSSATANKAIKWMAKKGIIGYYAGKNGAGIRIFLNRASSSIGVRPNSGAKKNLPFSPTSPDDTPASTSEAPFKKHVIEDLDLEVYSRARPTAARKETFPRTSNSATEKTHNYSAIRTDHDDCGREETSHPILDSNSLNELVKQISRGLIPLLEMATTKAAMKEHEKTRTWLEQRGIPKAVRVAQKEAYNMLRRPVPLGSTITKVQSELAAGTTARDTPLPQIPPGFGLKEVADICLSLLETRGQSIDVTLSQISIDAGGFLLPQDVLKVKAHLQSIIEERIHEG